MKGHSRDLKCDREDQIQDTLVHEANEREREREGEGERERDIVGRGQPQRKQQGNVLVSSETSSRD